MDNLIIERSDEIGDVWTKRYEYLSLHFPHWADDLPYFTYPKHWPTYTPAQKQGLYMQWYASALELNVWTSSTVTNAVQDPATGQWNVTVERNGKPSRTLKVNHLVTATGLASSSLNKVTIPTFPGVVRSFPQSACD